MALSPNLSRVLKAILLAFLCLTVTIHAEECTDESTCLSGVQTSNGRVMLQAKAAKHQTVEKSQASTTCTDTLGWTNGGSGKDCAHYGQYCADGGPKPGKGWTLGATYNYPEDNCCVCGKGTTAQFVKITTGTCSEHGRPPINDKAACETAAEALGLHDTTASAGTWSNRPEGCYYKPGESTNNRLQFNGGGQGQGSDSARDQICGPIPAPTYELAGSGSTSCPDGQTLVNEESLCEEASAFVGYTYGGTTKREDRPSGCYYNPNQEKLYYNMDQTFDAPSHEVVGVVCAV